MVWLERYGIWAMARYAEVHAALRDWETFCSSAGVGLSDFRRETPWRPPSLLLEADPPEHSRAHAAVTGPSPRGPCATCATASPARPPGTAGVDTTVIGLGCALDCLARDPSQWQLLREDPTRAGAAFEESLRYASPVQTFFRTTTRDVTVDGVRIGAGEKVLLFLAAANRDPRRWDDPDRFDLRRRAQAHVAFGFGIHVCVGAALARLELAGEPRRRLNNTLSGFASLPLRLVPAAAGAS